MDTFYVNNFFELKTPFPCINVRHLFLNSSVSLGIYSRQAFICQVCLLCYLVHYIIDIRLYYVRIDQLNCTITGILFR